MSPISGGGPIPPQEVIKNPTKSAPANPIRMLGNYAQPPSPLNP